MSPANSPLHRAVAVLAAVASLAALLLAIILVRSRNASRRASREMSLAFATEKPVLDQAAQDEHQRDAALKKKLAKISAAQRAARKPAEIVKALPAAFPPLPQPITVSLTPHASDAPEPPAVITVPRDDLKPLFDQLESCRACQQELAAARQDLSDERAKVSALMIERDAALQAARGGGFWYRLRSGAKWFAIGAATGALAAASTRR